MSCPSWKCCRKTVDLSGSQDFRSVSDYSVFCACQKFKSPLCEGLCVCMCVFAYVRVCVCVYATKILWGNESLRRINRVCDPPQPQKPETVWRQLEKWTENKQNYRGLWESQGWMEKQNIEGKRKENRETEKKARGQEECRREGERKPERERKSVLSHSCPVKLHHDSWLSHQMAPSVPQEVDVFEYNPIFSSHPPFSSSRKPEITSAWMRIPNFVSRYQTNFIFSRLIAPHVGQYVSCCWIFLLQ